jgi:hypothetical protein
MSTDIKQRSSIADDATIEGDDTVWVLTANDLEVIVRNFTSGRMAEYMGRRPMLVIKNTADCSVNNSLILDEAGNTLYTFAADNSVTPAYVALRLVDGDRNSVAWELA